MWKILTLKKGEKWFSHLPVIISFFDSRHAFVNKSFDHSSFRVTERDPKKERKRRKSLFNGFFFWRTFKEAKKKSGTSKKKKNSTITFYKIYAIYVWRRQLCLEPIFDLPIPPTKTLFLKEKKKKEEDKKKEKNLEKNSRASIETSTSTDKSEDDKKTEIFFSLSLPIRKINTNALSSLSLAFSLFRRQWIRENSIYAMRTRTRVADITANALNVDVSC